MTLAQIKNGRGDVVGEFNTNTKVYSTQRDWNKNQVYKKIGNKALALDCQIIRMLKQNDCKALIFMVRNMPSDIMPMKKKYFYASIPFDDFIKNSFETNYDLLKNGGRQRRCDMDWFEIKEEAPLVQEELKI